MSASASPTAIPGERIDPPTPATPAAIERLESREGLVGTGVGIGFRAFSRFADAKGTLLAAGTTYYLFLALFSVITFAYGLSAALGADLMAAYVTEGLSAAFPGLLGGEGIDPAQLRSAGQTTSIIGAVGLLYGGTGAVVAAVSSVHLVYGAPKDTRNVVRARLRAVMWLLVLAPIILVSYVASTFVGNFSDRVIDALGLDWQGPRALINLAALALTLAADFLTVYLILRRLGGIRPSRRASVVGAAVGAVAIELLKTVMSLLVQFTIDRPRYGAFAAPIGIMFVLFLQSMALYVASAVTAAVAESEAPADLHGTDGEENGGGTRE